MYYLLILLNSCGLMAYLQASGLMTTYSGTTSCNQTIALGVGLFSGVVDFSYEHKPSKRSSIFSCIIRITTLPGSFIVVRFLPSPSFRLYEFTQSGCRTQLTIKSNELNIEQCNVFPRTELISLEFVDISYKIKSSAYNTERRFKMIFFIYSLQDSMDNCQSNKTLCVGSNRCIYRPLKCSPTYDFCNNNLIYCQNNTHKNSLRTRPVSLTGLYVILSFLFFLFGVTVYTCFCRGLHLCECICHCCTTVDSTGSDLWNVSGQTGNGNVENLDGQDENIERETGMTDNASENNSDSVDVNFDLPPSYSYLERTDIASDAQDVSDAAADTSVNELSETDNPNMIEGNSTELPPSYSTVLHHEEEYNVHIY